jgi:hypothetical protein
MGKTSNAMMVFPYGMHANVDKDSIALMLQVLGDNGSKAAIPMSHKGRPVLAPDEVSVFHPPSGSLIHFKSNGDIAIESGTKVTIGADVEINGNLTIPLVSGGAANLESLITKIANQTYLTHTHVCAAPGSPSGPPVGA